MIIISLIRIWYYLLPRKIQLCKQIKTGITLKEFINKFGKPVKTEINGEYWLLFSSDKFAAGLIKIRINKSNNEIVELKCTEDSPSEWILDK